MAKEQAQTNMALMAFSDSEINCNHHQRKRIVSRNKYNRVDYDYYAKTTHPTVHKNMTPRAVLLKTSLTPLNIVRPVNTAHPKPAVHSAKSIYVNTAMRHYHTERPIAGNTARSYTEPVDVVRAKRVNIVKTSACWVWRPTKPNGASLAFKRHNYIDARGRSNGCSRHITGNIYYLSDFKEFDRGYVTFGGGAHGGRISVCACARFQVTLKTSHLLAVKRIFRYLKGKPTLGLWYSRDSPFKLVAYTDSDYDGATQDRKSTTGEGNLEEAIAVKKAIDLLRQTIGSSPGENTRITKPESTNGDSVISCVGA
ncbi:hypothetical protein Tco_1180399 [Tanacetum coccineum]